MSIKKQQYPTRFDKSNWEYFILNWCLGKVKVEPEIIYKINTYYKLIIILDHVLFIHFSLRPIIR